MTQTVFQNESGKTRDGYAAIRNGVGIIDFSGAGKLELSGKNSVQFLNGLVSNDVKTLEPGHGVLAAFPTLQGKLSALARIYNTGEHLLIELDRINREKIFKNLSRFVPAGEFFVKDVSDEISLLSLQGPQSDELLEALTGKSFSGSGSYDLAKASITGMSVTITRHSRCGETGFDLFVDSSRKVELIDQLIMGGSNFGVRMASPEAYETARIEAGVPREGVDAGENYIILESELNEAVSYTKGCYLGQEVIARIHWRGQPAKRLRGFLVDAESPPSAGTELFAADGKKVGEITSSIHSIALDRPIALGYVHRYYLEAGTEFTLKSGETQTGRAQLVEPPFIGK